MNIISQNGGYLLIGIFGLVMIVLTWLASRDPRWMKTQVGFLVAGRDVHWWLAAPSIAASWIWAPALFASVQKAYELGLPGIFWFTVPNIFALVVFAWLAPQIRNKIPGGYTLPDWIRHRFGENRLHRIYMVPYILVPDNGSLCTNFRRWDDADLLNRYSTEC
jgi:Na+/proline symporter